MNHLETIRITVIIIDRKKLLDHLVCLEFFVVEGLRAAVEEVVLVIDFDFVHEEFAGLVGEVLTAVVFVDFERGAGQNFKQELQDDDELFFHHGLICGDDGFLFLFADALSVDFEDHFVQVVIVKRTNTHLGDKILHNLHETIQLFPSAHIDTPQILVLMGLVVFGMDSPHFINIQRGLPFQPCLLKVIFKVILHTIE